MKAPILVDMLFLMCNFQSCSYFVDKLEPVPKGINCLIGRLAAPGESSLAADLGT